MGNLKNSQVSLHGIRAFLFFLVHSWLWLYYFSSSLSFHVWVFTFEFSYLNYPRSKTVSQVESTKLLKEILWIDWRTFRIRDTILSISVLFLFNPEVPLYAAAAFGGASSGGVFGGSPPLNFAIRKDFPESWIWDEFDG